MEVLETMLKTNSKQVRYSIRLWIMNNYDGDGYDLPESFETFKEYAEAIYNIFQREIGRAHV